MSLNINIWTSLCVLAVGQGLFLALVLLFHKRGNQVANRLLAILVLVFTLRLGEFVGYWIDLFVQVPHLLFTAVSFQFLFGVLLSLYARSITQENRPLTKGDVFHFIPFALHLSLLLPFYIKSADYKLQVLQDTIYTNNPTFSPRFFITEGLQDIHMMTYAILTFVLIRRWHQNSGESASSIARINIGWLQNLTIGFGAFILFDMLHLLDLGLFGYNHVAAVDSTILFLSAILIYILGYMALRQPELYHTSNTLGFDDFFLRSCHFGMFVRYSRYDQRET